MKALILSANAGQGHNSCANAIREVFQTHGDFCEVADVFGLVSQRLSESISKNHDQTYRHKPRQNDASYRFWVRHPQLFAKEKLIYQVMSMGRKQISRCIREGGYDTVLCTHVLAGMILTAVSRKERLPIKTAFIATDYACTPGINGTELNRYFIPHAALIPDFVEAEVPSGSIRVSGIPVHSAFCPAADKPAAKQHFHVHPSHRHLLVMCGSMGCGPIPELLRGIVADLPGDWEITVVCGTNQTLERQLLAEHGSHPAVHILGYAKEMPLLLASTDLYLTKPGGLSTAEAAASAVPMVFVDAVAGCEENNLRHFVSLGAAVTGSTADDVIRACLDLMNHPKQLDAMADLLRAQPASSAAETIWQEMNALF